jgi:hypothetical protein
MRTLIVVLMLAVGLSFALTSVALALAAEDELDKIHKTTGVEASLTVNPEQFQQAIGAALEEAGGDPRQVDRDAVDAAVEDLTEDHLAAIEALPYVRNASGTTGQPVNYAAPGEEEETDDPAASEPTPAPNGGPSVDFVGTPPDAVLTGTHDASFLTDFAAGGTKQLVEGRLFDASDEGSSVVVIDQNTATTEGLSVGDMMTLEGGFGPFQEDDGSDPPLVEAEVIGIYQDLETSTEGGFAFAITNWYAPLSVLRTLQGDSGGDTLDSISVVVDTTDDLELLKTDLAAIAEPDLFSLTTTEAEIE